MLTSAHFRRPSLRNFNNEITGYMKMLLNSAFFGSMLRGRSHVQQVILLNITVEKGSKDVVLVRGVASHCCGPGSIPGLGVRCGLSLLFAMVLASQVFLRILQFSSLHKNKHSKFPFYLQTMNKGKPPCG